MATYRVRHDGWTPQRQRAFLRALSETGVRARRLCAGADFDHLRLSDAATVGGIRPGVAAGAGKGRADDRTGGVRTCGQRVGGAGMAWRQDRRAPAALSDGLLRLLLTRGATQGAEEDDRRMRSGGWDRATQAETDAMLIANIRAFKRQQDANAARKALPAPVPVATTRPIEQGNGDAGDADRGAAGAVRHGDGPRIWTLPR